MTYSELTTDIPTPTYLVPGNMIDFSWRDELTTDDYDWSGIGMITELHWDQPGLDSDEVDFSNIRWCLTIQCSDGKSRYGSIHYIKVSEQESELAVQFPDGLYEIDYIDEDNLVINSVFSDVLHN